MSGPQLMNYARNHFGKFLMSPRDIWTYRVCESSRVGQRRTLLQAWI